MPEKIGRNDLCPCGSGKKYKQCCIGLSEPGKKKFKAVVLNSPASKQQMQQSLPNLMDRTFGSLVEHIDPNENLLVTEPYPENVSAPDGYVSPLEEESKN